jgi:hypothetical protein
MAILGLWSIPHAEKIILKPVPADSIRMMMHEDANGILQPDGINPDVFAQSVQFAWLRLAHYFNGIVGPDSLSPSLAEHAEGILIGNEHPHAAQKIVKIILVSAACRLVDQAEKGRYVFL